MNVYKKLTWIFVTLLFVSFVSATMNVSYNETSTTLGVFADNSIPMGQQFIANGSGFNRFQVAMKKQLSPTGIIGFGLVTDNGADQIGTMIKADFASIDVSTLTTSFVLYNLSMTPINNLTDGTKYWVQWRKISGNAWAAGGNYPGYGQITDSGDLWQYYTGPIYRQSSQMNMRIFWAEVPTTNYFEIIATDWLKGTTIKNITAYINGTTYSSETGRITTTLYNNNTFLHYVNISSNESGGYVVLELNNANISTDLNFRMYQSQINITIRDAENSSLINGFNVTFNNSASVKSSVLSSLLINLSDPTITFTVSKPNYIDSVFTQTFSVGDLLQYTANLTRKSATISNCSYANVNRTATFFIKKEPDPSVSLVADFEIYVTYLEKDIDAVFNISFLANNSANYSLCINDPKANNTLDVLADVYIQYNVPSGFTHRYYLYNVSFTDTAQDFYLYNYDSVTGLADLKVTTRYKTSYNYYPNILGKLQRFYVGEGVWRTVQMDLSGDYGLIFFNVDEEDVDYRILFTDQQNNVLRTTNSMKFICDAITAVCDLTFLLEPFSGTDSSQQLSVTPSYDNNTGIITVVWNDPLGATTNVRMQVTKETPQSTTTICNTNQSGASGVMTCDVSQFTGTVLLRVFSSASPEGWEVTEWIELSKTRIANLLTVADSSFFTAMILMVIGMAGMISPAIAPIAMVVGLIVIYWIGLLNVVTIPLIIVACVLGVVIGLKVKR